MLDSTKARGSMGSKDIHLSLAVPLMCMDLSPRDVNFTQEFLHSTPNSVLSSGVTVSGWQPWKDIEKSPVSTEVWSSFQTHVWELEMGL